GTEGNGWLKVYHFGIYALSLYDKYTGEGTRVRLNVEALDAYPHVRAWFLKEKPKREQEPELLREEIRTAGMDLLQAAPVRIHPDFLVKKGKGVVRRCPRCGEWYPAVLGDLCRRCQGDGPYLAGKE
uniref:FmdE family protein n=1 Tax=Desulfovibrio sp. TaxID=885 RepID=UPI003078619F